MSQEYDYLFKCIAVGDGGCGKTALTVRFAHGFFQEQYKMTIGVEFAVKLIEIGGFKTKLQIWDTGGQERFSYVRPLYYKGAMGALCVFDLTNRESFDHVPNWIDEVKANVGEVPMVLVGNKADLPGREVPRDEAEGTAKKFNMYYLESSAKTGDGVGDCFGVLAAMMIGIEPPSELLVGTGPASEAPPVPVVAARSLPQQNFAGEYGGSEEIPPVPQPADGSTVPMLSGDEELTIPQVPVPAKGSMAPILLGDEDLEIPPVPEPVSRASKPKVEDFEVPPVPPPAQAGKKFVPSDKVMGGKGPSKQPVPKPVKVSPVKPVSPAKVAPVKPAATAKPQGASKVVPPPLVFAPPPPEVFEAGENVEELGDMSEETPRPVVAKPITFDSEPAETVFPAAAAPLVNRSAKSSPAPKAAGTPFPIKPPTPGAIKPAPAPSTASQSKKASLSSFIPRLDESVKPAESETDKSKSRRSAIPFLGASKGAASKTAGFVPFSPGGAAAGKSSETGEGGKKFLNLFVPTVDQVKKGEVLPPNQPVEAPARATKSSKKSGSAPKQTPSQPPAEDFIVCSNCGHTLNKAYKFCNRCGARVK